MMNRWRTVSALAGRRKKRRRSWAMRWTPKAGYWRLRASTLWVVAARSLSTGRLTKRVSNKLRRKLRTMTLTIPEIIIWL